MSTARRRTIGFVAFAGMAVALSGCATPADTGPDDLARYQAIERSQLAKLPDDVVLAGLDENQLKTYLGTPTLVREENGSQYWRYNLAGCQLDIFLYHAAGGEPRVAYYDVRPAEPNLPAGHCDLLADRLRADVGGSI
ncbi:MAG: hypothetical protein U1E45_09175 [Geminicoccaceae bacterium]